MNIQEACEFIKEQMDAGWANPPHGMTDDEIIEYARGLHIEMRKRENADARISSGEFYNFSRSFGLGNYR